MATEDTNSATLSAHIAVVYKDAIDNLMFMKKQQWTVTNYLVAIFAGIFAFSRAILNLGIGERVALASLVVLALCYGFYLLIAIQVGMAKFRRRLAWINKTFFSENELQSLELLPVPKSTLHNWDFLFGLIGVATIAAGLVLYSLGCH